MAIIGNIATFYEDIEKTKPVFPITKTSAISDNNGKGLDAILEDIKKMEGPTPIKGQDYWTDSDKQEIVDAVKASFSNAEGAKF